MTGMVFPREAMKATVPGNASDWPEEMETACERMRLAAQAAVDRLTGDNMQALECARRAFGVHVLRLDRRRRADFYAAMDHTNEKRPPANASGPSQGGNAPGGHQQRTWGT